ncbi:probetacellulin isoform X2 [Carassius auratus]|uniref:Probetacellulin isoform X2 n=1 Tax=Carassius auratus TaxID=7957 RepID=A0A6P6M1T2_CARAU|nr:probetacellulin-like isoform X2 [Carassius auratus]XP_052392375.1 probetacellulin isoform X2 [Carassius gibelio]
MDRTRRFILGIVTAVVLCKYSQAEWNTTKTPSDHHDNSNNCTDSNDEHKWSGHFSTCPTEYKHYCIHGVCRFLKEQNTPSCRRTKENYHRMCGGRIDLSDSAHHLHMCVYTQKI